MVKSRIIAFVACLAIYFTMTIHSRAEDTKLTVMVFRGGQNLPLFAAQAKGFFAKRGAVHRGKVCIERG